MRRFVLAFGLAGGFAAGLALLNDAGTNALLPPDPVTGRERGCYTAIELLLGLRRPSELARFVEGILGGVLIATPWVFYIRKRPGRVAGLGLEAPSDTRLQGKREA